MSAIALIWHFNERPVEHEEIVALTDSMRSRSPDGIEVWREGPVAIGRGWLIATPEANAETRPVATLYERWHIVWDGRLDNRDALIRELLSRGIVLRDCTDREIVLQTFAIFGKQTPQKLLGDFAFAIWDTSEKSLFLARDHVGARPLFYVHGDDFFALASEDDALLTLPGVSREINPEKIAYYLVPAFDDLAPTATWFKDIHALAPATHLTVYANKHRETVQYWSLQQKSVLNFTDSDAQAMFEELWLEAVRARCRGSNEGVVMASGGMDSLSICRAVARLVSNAELSGLRTFSAADDKPQDCIETRAIYSMIDCFSASASVVNVPSFSSAATACDVQDAVWKRPHPVVGAIPLVTTMFMLAGRAGHRSMLHGVCGDVTTFAPWYYFKPYLKNCGISATWDEVKSAATNNPFLRELPPSTAVALNAYTLYTPSALKRLVRKWRERSSGSAIENSAIHCDFARKLNMSERIRALQDATSAVSGSDVFALHKKVLFPTGVTRGLEGYDRAAGRFGIEPRDPWADVRLIEFFTRLPIQQRIRLGWTKWLVRRAMGDQLPKEAVWRADKTHLGHFFIDASYPQKEKVEAALSSLRSGPFAQFVDFSKLTPQFDPDGAHVRNLVILNRWYTHNELKKT